MSDARPVGVSILTNGNRLWCLKRSLRSLLGYCSYRPLIVGIFDNGSTDDTPAWLADLPWVPGVDWRVERSGRDLGCAAGTNKASELVRDCNYVLHLESDFELLPPDISGEDDKWLNRAVELLESSSVDYLYLRRMVSSTEMYAHWWSKWPGRFAEMSGNFVRVKDFWWSNNPNLRSNSEIYQRGILPLRVDLDGPKGTIGWSRPEMCAGNPRNAWVHKWGLFAHMPVNLPDLRSKKVCVRLGGLCKYGFLLEGGETPFCQACDLNADFRDMQRHAEKFRGRI